jgi:hypothetical protein
MEKIYAGSPAGRSNRGNNVSVSKKEFTAAIWFPESSRTINAHGLYPPSGFFRYCPKAGEPQAMAGSNRDPRRPEPIPNIQVRTDSGP